VVDGDLSLARLYEAMARREPLPRLLERAAEMLEATVEGSRAALFALRDGCFYGHTAAGGPDPIWGRFEGTHAEPGQRQAPWWPHRGRAVAVEQIRPWCAFLSDAEIASWPCAWSGDLRTPAGEIAGCATLLLPEYPDDRVVAQWAGVTAVAALAIEQENLLAELTWQAERDALTGLFNRQQFERALDGILAGPAAEGSALFWFSLDRWTRVNRLLGHRIGDTIVLEAAARLRRGLRAHDVCARVGDREFACAIATLKPDEALLVARRLQEALSAPYEVDGHVLTMEAEAALCHLESGAGAGAEWMQRGRLALAQARTAANRFAVFNPAMQDEAGNRLELEQRLRQARPRDELMLYYQPQLGLADDSFRGVEALMRWRAGEMGVVSPSLFIPLAEEIGLIEEFGEWALAEACRQGSIWREQGLNLRIGVNVSPRQLQHDGLASKVEEILHRTGFPAAELELEITESGVLSDLALARRLLDQLRARGVRLALDDFGTGHSSLAYLHDLPVDRVKIDRSFVAAAQADSPLLEHIVGMAHALGMETIAEGVETDAQWEILRRIRCDEGQGFRWGRPMPAQQIEAWLGARTTA
jgi:diguanylate cyclase (GGDEF)-like protein